MRLRVIKIICAALAFALVFSGFQRLLMPKYATQALEGNLTREYYSSARSHDVIFLGDCEVYANFSPITLWEEYGITSFIRGGAQQLIWHSYYLLHDTLRYETPKVVVFNVLAMQYDEPQSEAYDRLNLDGMRNSPAKFNAIAASSSEGADWLSYVFPLLRYKDRWKELSSEDFRYFLNNPRVSVNGFMVRSDIMPVDFLPDPIRRADYTFGDTAYHYLERMVSLAKANGIELVLVKAPALFPHWFDEWDAQIVEFAGEHGLLYVNLLEHTEDMGLDFSTDTFNAGLHLNVFGAEKAARFFGGILSDSFGLPDRRGDPGTAAVWNGLTELYHSAIARQQREIEEHGKIQSFLLD